MNQSLLFTLDGKTELAEAIIDSANLFSTEHEISLGYLNKQKFSDGELCVDFTDSVRGKSVFLLSSPNTSDAIINLALAIDAAKRGGAKEIIPILPYFPYARQDKKDQSRGPIGAKVMAEIIEQRGATSVITFDLHADQIQGFFNIPVTHIEGKHVFDSYINDTIKNFTGGEVVLCGPDAGSGKRVKRMRDQINKRYGVNLNIVMIDKTRKKANVIDEMIIIGDVKGKHVIILDDMVDTAGTLCKAAEVLKDAGALTVRAIIAHGVLSGPAVERIGESKLAELVISDSLPMKDAKELCHKEFNETKCHHIIKGCEKTTVISVAQQIGMGVSASINKLSYEALKSIKAVY
jgi:ribose-phosphate pyrophosphokinase